MEDEKSANDKGQSNSNGKILMATVKGDVHDIGKNIVGVVLQCNNYEVIDLGVMVPAAKILETARELAGRHHRAFRADHAFARRDVSCGGRDGAAKFRAAAADRRRHHKPCAYGREDPSELPQGRGGLCHGCQPRGRRASIADVEGGRPAYIENVRSEYAQIAAAHARGQDDKKRLSLADARKNALALDPQVALAPKPQFLGTRVLENDPLAKIVAYIDWTPFFSTWELTGTLPGDSARRKNTAKAARSLFADAQAMVKQIVDEQWVQASAVVGFWPAGARW